MSRLGHIYNISEAKKSVATIRDIQQENLEFEQKIRLNIKKSTAISIIVLKLLSISYYHY